MRIFWGLMLVLVLGSAGNLYGKLSRPEQRPQIAAHEPAPSELAKEVVQAPAAEPEAPAQIEPSAPPLPAPEGSPGDQPLPADPTLDAGSLDAMLGTMTGAAVGADRAEPANPSPTVTPEAAPAAVPAPASTIDASSDAAAGAPAAQEPVTDVPVAPAKPPTFAGYQLIPATRTVRDDGSLLLDDRFIVSGKGTEAEPYKITWDLLASSSQTLDPRHGKKALPERITMLDGAWVELSGYIAFPLMVQEADELLLMLNQWDGCCIGVPPTPYDAIEVSLTKKVKGQDRFAVEGTLKGKLGVKPHLVGDWLVGIYVMDSATLSTRAIGGVSQ